MMKRVSLYLLIVSICSINCELSFAQGAQDTITNYVNPFIGTLGDGNVFAGACLPHSFIKLGPDTKYNSGAAGYKKGWAVKGFSHLHITGMGGPMYGNIQLIPTTGKVESLNHFSPTSYENATPGFYSVYLEKYHTSAQLTSSRHVGFHKYIFPKSNNAHILVDVGATLYGKNPTEWGSSKPIGGQVNIDPSGNAVYGFGSYQGSRSAKKPWKVFFYAIFNTPFKSSGTWNNSTVTNASIVARGNEIGAVLNYDTKAGQNILAKVGISMVSVQDAKASIESEIPGWNFEGVKTAAHHEWEVELKKIEVKGLTKTDKKIFYTALYHGLLMPSDWSGQNPALAKNKSYYEDFCVCGTFTVPSVHY